MEREMEGLGAEGELGAGYTLVPWSSWDQWNFVRESLFSSSPDSVAAAFRRITAWRSRGCLPVAVEVTAAFVEIRQKDPFFRKEPVGDILDSEEMLAMLYSMALMRLVNGFVEKVNGFDDHAHKHKLGKKKHSISQLADAIGIPRMVVDIRHESSHRDLPSLPLVRLASTKALDWLKFHYWEPQKRAIPDVRKEIRSRLNQMIYHMRIKQIEIFSSLQIKGRCAKQAGLLRMCNKLSSQIAGKHLSSKSDGSEKQISKISRIIARLYSTYPLEVVSVLLEIFQLQAFGLYKDTDCTDYSTPDEPELLRGSIYDIKVIIAKLSSKRPGLIPTMLKGVLGMIETKEAIESEKSENYCVSSENQAEVQQINVLSSLVPWLLMKLRELRDSNQIGLVEESEAPPTSTKNTPIVSLKELLRKCLLLSVSGNKHLSDSALFVAEMIGSSSLSERVKKLPVLSSQHNLDFTTGNSTSYPETNLFQEEKSVRQAAEKLDLLKSRLREGGTRTTAPRQKKKMWTVAKNWSPCPIGMLPCFLSSTPFLPVLDEVDDGGCVVVGSDLATNGFEVARNDAALGKRAAASHDTGPTEDSTAALKKKLKETAENTELQDASGRVTSPMEGRLLIGGVWREVGEEELLAIESDVRILVPRLL